ncbi:MAG: SUMF1/EgtB/PvdO family nonheme iron enzyme [Gammaproteobacteria bacterium]|nr:SUMF1/EgtB/PvdO family nonheme iron enzyme [Gammaproteobacteria bacterium]
MSDSKLAPDTDPLDLRRIQRERRARVVIAVVVVAFIVCIPLLLFRTTAFKLEIGPERANETLRISTHEGVAMALGKRILLFGQSTKFRVESVGFHLYESQIDRSNKERVLPILMSPLPGSVTIKVQASSDVWLEFQDSDVSGPPPLSMELERGVYLVSVTGNQIVPLQHEFQVVGYGEPQEIQLVTEESSASMTVQVIPSTADVEINGIPVGRGGYSGTIAVGTHEISFVAEYHLPHRQQITVGVNEDVDLGLVELRPQPASLEVTSMPSDASILLDGKYVGSTPSRVTIGANRAVEIKVRKPNFVTQTATLELLPGQSVARSFNLDPVKIQAEVTSMPEANVWLNGERKGTTPSTFVVHVGDIVKVTKEGFASQSVEISAAGPNKRSLNFTLVDEFQDTYNKAPELLFVQNTITLRKVPPIQVSVSIPTEVAGGSESNAREFELTRAFYLGTHEIRRKEYAKFATSLTVDTSNENLPIAEISWAEAARFCNWLSSQENLESVYVFRTNGEIATNPRALGFRLPTEAEWEAATQLDIGRNAVIGVYPWGNASIPKTGTGNYSGRESRQDMHPFLNDHLDNHSGVAPVGSYRQNANGFHDLGGNVAEWVHDFYESKSHGWNRKLRDPLGPQSGLDRIVKGANFRTHDLKEMYVNARKVVGLKDETVGFRVAKWIW